MPNLYLVKKFKTGAPDGKLLPFQLGTDNSTIL